MIDVELLRSSPESVKESLKKRGDGDTTLVDRWLTADHNWRDLTAKIDQLRRQRNSLAKTKDSAIAHKSQLQKIKKDLTVLEKKGDQLANSADSPQELIKHIPNMVADDVPIGPGSTANKVIRTIGRPNTASARTHEELMIGLDWLDLKTAAEFSGSRFRYLKNQAAWAELQLMHQAFSFAIRNGFTPVIPPYLLRDNALEGGGFFPFFKDDIFKVENQEVFLSGTSEPALLALAAKKTFSPSDLPLRLVGYSTCFRKEVGSYGQDVRGVFRQHQFDKVEMVSITSPDKSQEELEFLVGLQERFVNKFKLPYQVVLMGSGDLGPSAAKKFDIETWFAGQNTYRETHSASNCTDFQARRLVVKVRADKQEIFAHTLNATLATERLLLAIIEHNQTANGRVNLPRSLRF